MFSWVPMFVATAVFKLFFLEKGHDDKVPTNSIYTMERLPHSFPCCRCLNTLKNLSNMTIVVLIVAVDYRFSQINILNFKVIWHDCSFLFFFSFPCN